MGFPRTLADIDCAWLSGALGAEVVSFEHSFLEGGVLSDAFKLHDIRYANESTDAPPSAVAKLANGNDAQRKSAMANGVYVKELNFLRDLADDVPLRTPKIYAIDCDDPADPEFFVILMEDLTVHSLVFDQVDDPPNEAFTRRIAQEVAGMHAKFWDAPILDESWISPNPGRYVFSMDENCRRSPDHKDEFVRLWQQMFGISMFDTPGCPQAEETTEILCGPKCDLVHDYFYEVLSSRPRTLVHSDLRADNLFRTDPASGHSVEESELTYIDWQLVTAGPPGPEFTQAWQHSLPPSARRKDKDILKSYHTRLVELNPAAAAYSYEMLVDDYLMAYLFWWSNLVTLGTTVLINFDKPEGQRMKALWGQGLVYAHQAMAEHDCLDRLRRVLAEVS